MSEHVLPRAVLEAQGAMSPDVVGARTSSGRVVDLHTPVAKGEALTPIVASEPDGLAIIRHSTAHVMADAVQRLFPGTKVTIGPSVEDGFYYDFDKPGGAFTDEDLGAIERAMLEVIAGDTPFRREVVSRERAIELFTQMGETYKVEIIRAIPEGEEISLYRHGKDGAEWMDVCEGPHVPTTGMLRAIKLTSVAGAYWRGDERNPMLQRIYGTAFASPEALTEHLELLELARQRDHRKVGRELDLFFFDPVAPAMPFFLPNGAFVYNRLVDYIRELYVDYGYDEVITPQAFDPKLFRTSGHLANYADNMFRLWTEDQLSDAEAGEHALVAKEGEGQPFYKTMRDLSFGLKPMNCPSHCVIFGSRRRSYRELPWRMADFGRLHRYERGGVVHGLSRVRTFCQDDAHIFCAEEDVAGEIEKFIALLREVYLAFGFSDFGVRLALRPEQRIGTDAEWDRSERALSDGLERAGLPFDLAPGEGAFYGPKVEFHIKDALKRSWQLGTIQFDPNLPERFDLSYVGADGNAHRPIMLHRAVLGSLERFFSVYIEHCGGAFPTWIAPKQVMVLTVSAKSEDYGRSVLAALAAAKIRAEADFSADKLGAKIRAAHGKRHPYMLVVGPKDAEAGTVSVRARDGGDLGAMPLAQFIERVAREARSPRASQGQASPIA